MRRGAVFLLVSMVLIGLQGAHAQPAAADTWCGADGAAQDRKPDTVAGYQVHLIYAVPSDQPEHFYADAALITEDIAALDAWWRREDPTRTVRFDLAAFPCTTTFGTLDISYVRLPHDAAFYGPSGGRDNNALGNDLSSSGFTDSPKKYLVYYDGPTSEPYCGYASILPDRGGTYSNAVVLVRATVFCGTLGGGGYKAVTAAHELVHSFGAVTPTAPHVCPNEAHICGDPSDLMSSAPGFSTLSRYFLDVGRDDYYDHPGSWWDVRDSRWLIHRDVATYALTIVTSGGGAGDVASDVPGMSCPKFFCTKAWEAGSAVQLTATAAAGSLFMGWSGACNGNGPCSLKIDGPTNVTARFEKAVVLTVAIDQSKGKTGGTVHSEPAAIDCPGPTCVNIFAAGTTVKLVANPWSGYRVDSWGGVCPDHAESCTVTTDVTKTITVMFGLASRNLTINTQGNGQVKSGTVDRTCTGQCRWTIDVDTQVELVAQPSKGWRFTRWSGTCEGGSPKCSIALTEDAGTTAVFSKAPLSKCRPGQKSSARAPCRN